jgi:hypothetical protein
VVTSILFFVSISGHHHLWILLTILLSCSVELPHGATALGVPASATLILESISKVKLSEALVQLKSTSKPCSI